MVLGIKYVVDNVFAAQHAAEHLGGFDRHRTHEYRLLTGVRGFNLIHDGFKFFALCFVDLVVEVHAPHGAVGGNNHYVELVDLVELIGFRFGRTGHAGEFFVHPEIVLDGDGSEGLGFPFDLHAFLGFDGLVQSVAPAAAGHQAASVFVDNHNLIVLHHIVDVLFIDTIGADQLVDGMDTFVAQGKFFLNCAAFFHELLGRELGVAVELGHGRNHVGQDIHFRIGRVEFFTAFLGQSGIVSFFVDGKEQLLPQFTGKFFACV